VCVCVCVLEREINQTDIIALCCVFVCDQTVILFVCVCVCVLERDKSD